MNSRISQLRYNFNRKRDIFLYKMKEVAAFTTAIFLVSIPILIVLAWLVCVCAVAIIVLKLAWFMMFYWDSSQGLNELFR